MQFSVSHQEGFARSGTLSLHHGEIQTPVFMPVGTYGAVKTILPTELEQVGTQILLGNTYHLAQRPGPETLEHFGGLHQFMGWDKPILTDSGGFQVFSLGQLRKITEQGVSFRSPLNGDLIELTPESCARIQQSIGSDIAMVLDECPPLPSSTEDIRQAVERSYRWAKRFLDVPRKEGQAVFGIFQGGTDLSLRQESLELTLSLPVDGIAIGGLSVGESHGEMVYVLDGLAATLPAQLPHYLMGVGTPLDLIEAVRCGVDMFDCVLPTRNGRNGGFFTDDGLINIRNSQFKTDNQPIDPDCSCPCCTHHSRGYLRHLFQIKEILGCRLATLHNLHYYHRFMFRMREAIKSGSFAALYSELKPRLEAGYAKTRAQTSQAETAQTETKE